MNRGFRVHVASDDPATIAAAAARLSAGPEDMLVVMVAEKGAPDLDVLVRALNRTERTFIGGLFPALIVDGQRCDSGALLFVLPMLSRPLLVPLDREPFLLPAALPSVSSPKPTAVVLVDGLSAGISPFLQAVYHQLGNRVSYWGGGAGSLTLRPRPCVFTRDGAHQAAAVIALSSLPSRLGVRHGWRELKGPYVVTRSRRNVIVQLNWKNALDLYRAAVESDLGVPLTLEGLFRLSPAYPFGLRKEGQEVVVRDPIAPGQGGTLVCVGDVPENAVLSILKGEAASLTAAAAQAAHEAGSGIASGGVRHCLLADCVSRAQFLADGFPAELAAISRALRDQMGNSAAETIGMLTLGEISSAGQGTLEFFNKTSVVAVVHEA